MSEKQGWERDEVKGFPSLAMCMLLWRAKTRKKKIKKDVYIY